MDVALASTVCTLTTAPVDEGRAGIFCLCSQLMPMQNVHINIEKSSSVTHCYVKREFLSEEVVRHLNVLFIRKNVE